MLSRRQIYRALSLLFVLSTPVYGDNRVNDINFDAVNWNLLCRGVEAIQFEQNGLSCEVSHPASKFHNSKVHAYIVEKMPAFNSCDHLEKEYFELTTPKASLGKDEEWKLCMMVFKSSLIDRTVHPERYQHSVEDWEDAYFNDNTLTTEE